MKREEGITLIEVLIVVALLTMIGGFGLLITSNFYRSQSIHTDQNTLISVLRFARSQAMSNVHQVGHGVYVSPTDYTVFQGSSYAARDVAYDEVYAHGGGVILTGLSEITFQPIHGGASASGSMMIGNGTQTTTISINSEGRIYW